VAGGAIAGRHGRGGAGVVHGGGNEGGEAADVAGVALGPARNMGGRLGQRIDGRVAAGVAGGALAGKTRMVHAGRLEGGVVGVAGVALGRGRNMGGRLAERCCAIVASRAGAGGRGRMSVGSPGPHGSGFMAGVALRGGDEMGCGFGLGIGESVAAAMAGRAVCCGDRSAGVGVIHGGGSKRGVVLVTGVALRRGRDMRGRLAQCVAAVVAA